MDCTPTHFQSSEDGTNVESDRDSDSDIETSSRSVRSRLKAKGRLIVTSDDEDCDQRCV